MKKEELFPLVGALVGGFILGKAGQRIFGGKEAKSFYTNVAAGALIARDYVMSNVETLQAAASDITTDAKAKAEEYQLKNDSQFDREQEVKEGKKDLKAEGPVESESEE